MTELSLWVNYPFNYNGLRQAHATVRVYQLNIPLYWYSVHVPVNIWMREPHMITEKQSPLNAQIGYFYEIYLFLLFAVALLWCYGNAGKMAPLASFPVNRILLWMNIFIYIFFKQNYFILFITWIITNQFRFWRICVQTFGFWTRI